VRSPAERLRDILEAITAIERHSGGARSTFERDEMRQVWFVRHLQIIGEATRYLPIDVRNATTEIPWPKIIGMRNVLVHGYFDIDADIVWQAVTVDIPLLKPAIQSLLERLESGQQ
jgi:uncharacterized protein with HEPN domain